MEKYVGMKNLIASAFGAILLVNSVFSQSTFQRTYGLAGADLMVFDAIETSDGGMAMAGLYIGSEGEVAMLVKLDCLGAVAWTRACGVAGADHNTHIRIMETSDQRLVMVNTTGNFLANTQDVVLTVSALDGSPLWQRSYGGSGNDAGNGIMQSADGNYVVCGNTGAYGTDAGTAYEDAFVMKIDAGGNVLWSVTLGNAAVNDGAFSLDEDMASGNLLVGGRMTANGSTYAMLASVSGTGTVQWVKGYGADNHATTGFAVRVDYDGQYLLAGSSTLAGSDYTAATDPFLIKVAPATGDTLWTRLYAPSDAGPDHASGIALAADSSSYILSVATASYAAFTSGEIPDKHALFATGTDGMLMAATLYNAGGSLYPHVRSTADGGVLLSGYSNQYTEPCCHFQPLLVKTDAALQSGCNEGAVTAETGYAWGAWNVIAPTLETGTGFTAVEFSGEGVLSFPTAQTLCENPPGLLAAFEWEGNCAGDSISFFDLSTGNVDQWLWDFGNGQTSTAQNPKVVFGSHATYEVTLTLSNSCQSVSATEEVVILFSPAADAGPDWQIVEGNETELGGNPTGPTSASFQWFPPQSLDNPNIQNPDAFPDITTQYQVLVTMPNGCSALDSVMVIVIEKPPVDTSGSLFVPTVFSPNNDGTNDLLWVFGGPFTAFSIEIFNRWGELVFESDDQFKAWDGKFRGTDCQIGAYYFSLLVRTPNGTESRKTGNITLFR